MFAFERKWFSRDEWFERGRIVCVTNEEAKDVANFWEGAAFGLKRGAWHVFSADQTAPIAQFQHAKAAA